MELPPEETEVTLIALDGLAAHLRAAAQRLHHGPGHIEAVRLLGLIQRTQRRLRNTGQAA